MQKEDEIIGMLGQIMGKLDEHSQILGKHSQILAGHSQQHENHTSTLKEHGQLLSALRTGQEYLKAELDGMKIANAKEFGSIKQRADEFNVHIELLRDESWTNKTDIQRVKNTMGMN